MLHRQLYQTPSDTVHEQITSTIPLSSPMSSLYFKVIPYTHLQTPLKPLRLMTYNRTTHGGLYRIPGNAIAKRSLASSRVPRQVNS